jgi:MFS superfamily sulfate permease-like transporter
MPIREVVPWNSQWADFRGRNNTGSVDTKAQQTQDSILGRLPSSKHFIDVERHPEAEPVPLLLIFRPNGIVFFANATRIRNRLRELIT